MSSSCLLTLLRIRIACRNIYGEFLNRALFLILFTGGATQVDQILQKCELFSRFFKFVVMQSQSSVHDQQTMPVPNAQIDHIVDSDADVWSVLSSLDPHKAEGPDKIHPRLLKECATPLTPPLTVLFNQCLTSTSIPLQ